jgi:hypothetical protein
VDNIREAKKYAEAAIDEARKGPRKTEGLGDRRHLNQALIQGAKVCLQLGERDRGLVLYREAMDLAVGSNRKLMITELLELEYALIEKKS